LAQRQEEDQSPAQLERALTLIAEALDVVDARGDCPEAAAYLDLAARSLRQQLAAPSRRDCRD
jgi:hypothetical protein